MYHRKTGYSHLNSENNRCDVTFAYVHERNKHSAVCFEHFFLPF